MPLAASSAPALETRGLSKRFGRTLAVRDLDLAIEAGAAVAVLGANGAGKTTLMRLCATLLRPTAGNVHVFGIDAHSQGGKARRRIGVLSHESFLYSDLTARENLIFYGRLYGVAERAQRVDFLLRQMGLIGWSERPVRGLSRGLVQRCALARVLLHDPDLLFLDEPFTGLDLSAQRMLCQTLTDVHRAGTTLVMSTHDLDFAFTLCTSAIILVSGGLSWQGSIDVTRRVAFEADYRRRTDATPSDSSMHTLP